MVHWIDGTFRNICLLLSIVLMIAGQIWDLFEDGRLFRAVKDGRLSDELHLAEMVALMGPPPKAF